MRDGIFFSIPTVLILILTIQLNIYGQNLCGADDLNQILLTTDKATLAKLHPKLTKKQQLQSLSHKKASGSWVRTVPVVFHIIHNNGPENIPDSLIYQQVDILNEDFRKLPGTPGDGAGVDTQIEFCLATIDPSGNATTGITRTQSACTDAYQPGCNTHPSSIIFWGDSVNKYLNIWIQKVLPGGVKGLGGTGYMVQVRYDCIGRNSIDIGRIPTHEVGHWLGLKHTFADGCGTADCATSGDYVCDTPPVASPNSNCSGTVNSCTNDLPDLPDQVANYMDYTNGICKSMFTQGQKTRMYLNLDNPNKYHYQLTTYANLQNTGCDPCSSPPCTPIADFMADKMLISIGDNIIFTDFAFYAPTSWQWFFPGGTPSTATVQNPIVTYDTAGIYDVTMIATNAAGSDTMVKQAYIDVFANGWSSLGTGLGFFDVKALEVYNNELYAGGQFTTTATGDTVNNIAKWDGTNWNSLAGGLNSNVKSLATYNNELYVCAANLYKWNDSSWSTVGAGILSPRDLVVYNNELYISSNTDLYKWDGTNLIQVTNADNTIGSLIVYDSSLYVTGIFNNINSMAAQDIAKYDGANWYDVGGSGLVNSFLGIGYANDMVVYDSMLYIGGAFDAIDGVSASNIARWDGTNWYPVGSGIIPSSVAEVMALTVWNYKLYVGGAFKISWGNSGDYITSWDNISWMPLGSGTNGSVKALTVWNNELYAGGSFTIAGGDSVNYIAKWGCSLNAGYTQSADTVDLAVSGDVQFTDQGVNAIQWIWDFGDGGISTQQNPVHTYGQEGTYTITLTVSNGTCLSTDTSMVVVQWSCYPLSVNFHQSTDTVNLSVTGDIDFLAIEVIADSVIWDFGDGVTDTTENPTHTYTQAGIYMVSLTGYGDTCSSTVSSTVVVIDNVGMESLESSSDLHIYPNPNTGQFTLEMDLQEKTELSINLYHFTGKLIRSEMLRNVMGNYTQQIDLSGYSKGVYFLQVSTTRGILTRKVVLY